MNLIAQYAAFSESQKMFSFSGWGRQKAKALPPVCNKWSEILTLFKVVKVRAEYWIKISVFRGFFKLLKTCQEVYVFCGSK